VDGLALILFGVSLGELPDPTFATTVDANEFIALKVLRSFLLAILPSVTEVVRGQVNRVPEPSAADYIVFWPLRRERLGTNEDVYSDLPGNGLAILNYGHKFTVQIDVHGPSSGDNAATIVTALRDDWAVDFFAAMHPEVAPLYADDARQMAFISGEKQYENRWIVEAQIEVNSAVRLPQQFADKLRVAVVPVDAMFP
jgi:hypothetical protein